jgi:hypothetical protein
MKTGFTLLAGVGVLSLVVGVGSATAATRHHYRHVAKSPAVQAPEAARGEGSNLATNGNNPAKRYDSRHMPEGAIKTSTLPTSGNNLAKPYATRHAPENAVKTGTLMQNGNNPAKHYNSTTTGAASR